MTINHDRADANCFEAFAAWRWPKGLRCPLCGGIASWANRKRGLISCLCCHKRLSVLHGTGVGAIPIRNVFAVAENNCGINHDSALATWLNGLSVLERQRLIKCYRNGAKVLVCRDQLMERRYQGKFCAIPGCADLGLVVLDKNHKLCRTHCKAWISWVDQHPFDYEDKHYDSESDQRWHDELEKWLKIMKPITRQLQIKGL